MTDKPVGALRGVRPAAPCAVRRATIPPAAWLVMAPALLFVLGTGAAGATEPCGDFGECKALVEINSTDGDIGFHFLLDGDDLNMADIEDPNGAKVFQYHVKGALMEQKLTESFAESAEPLCWNDPNADPDDEIVTLEDFLERWTPGTYSIFGQGDGGEKSSGATELTFSLPAAPENVTYSAGTISWGAGDDLGNCASTVALDMLVAYGELPEHPKDVTVDAWEIVLVPDVDDGDPLGALPFTVRVPGDISPKAVSVPMEYLDSLPPNTPAKMEIGAIGGEDNATFTEEAGLCLNETTGCD